MTVPNLVPNVPQTVYFDAANQGVTDQINQIPITIIAHDTYTNTETGRCVLYGTLLPTLTSGQTSLKITAVEKGTQKPIVGLQVQFVYPPSGTGRTIDLVTNANGETSSILSTPQGGAYIGDVFVHSLEDSTYNAASLTYPCNNAAPYETTFEVERKDTSYGNLNWTLILEIVGVVVAAALIGGLGFVAHKKIKQQQRRR